MGDIWLSPLSMIFDSATHVIASLKEAWQSSVLKSFWIVASGLSPSRDDGFIHQIEAFSILTLIHLLPMAQEVDRDPHSGKRASNEKGHCWRFPNNPQAKSQSH